VSRSPPLHDTCYPGTIEGPKTAKKGPKIKELTPYGTHGILGVQLIRRKTMEELTFDQFQTRPVKDAFENAWNQKHFLKDSPWMYMYSDTEKRVDYFKHSLTRKYQQVPY
tara:strand:+ start:895 stop:1224 length:330 start_codon:yes stop_codon:yes gene_type:complete